MDLHDRARAAAANALKVDPQSLMIDCLSDDVPECRFTRHHFFFARAWGYGPPKDVKVILNDDGLVALVVITWLVAGRIDVPASDLAAISSILEAEGLMKQPFDKKKLSTIMQLLLLEPGFIGCREFFESERIESLDHSLMNPAARPRAEELLRRYAIDPFVSVLPSLQTCEFYFFPTHGAIQHWIIEVSNERIVSATGEVVEPVRTYFGGVVHPFLGS